MVHYISFPGLGIGEFKLDAVAFELFGREVRWYGIIICAAIIAAFCYTAYRTGKFGLAFDDLLDYALITVPVAIIGARLYFISFEYFGQGHSYDSFYDAIAFWDGGLAIYGAIIGGAISVICISLYKKVKILRFMDAIGPGVMLGQVIGRWGNFMNAEAHGDVTTFFLRMGISKEAGASLAYTVHPTFFYESLWNLIGFALINLFYKKRRFDGQWLIAYIGWYGLGRGFIEQMRTDSLCIPGTALRISSLLGFATFFLSVIAWIVLTVKKPKALSPDGDIYLPSAKNGKLGGAVTKIVIPQKQKQKQEQKKEADEMPAENTETE